MEFHQIRYFLCVSEVLSFTRAADLCNISQPALTKAIQKLEANLGGPLFIRDNRQISLTSLGRSMRTEFSKIEAARNAARSKARSIVDKEMETLQVGVMCTLGSHPFQPALAAFQSENPNTELIFHDIWATKGKELLMSGAIDCALFGQHQIYHKNIEHVVLYEEQVGLVVGTTHPLAAKPEVKLADLTNFKYADRLRCEFRDEFLDIVKDRNLMVEISVRSEREDWIKDLIINGTHIAIMPQYSALHDALVFKPLSDLPVSRTVCIATTTGTARPKILDKFIKAVAREFTN